MIREINMKFLKECIIILFLLIVSMGVVCAEDANQTSDALNIADAEVISDAPEGTFTDLDNDIKSSSGSIDLGRDYKYNTNDNIENIIFNNVNYTIDGNNHAIDGDGKTYVFRIENNSNITMKNLILRNCNDSSIILLESHLITINVTFMNNEGPDGGAAMYCDNSFYSSINDKFTENYAPKQGASIIAFESDIFLTNATFTNKNPICWSLIYGNGCMIDIRESIFRNINSTYATVVYNNHKTFVKDSKFINLHANGTAGAIALKGSAKSEQYELTIENCEFINVSANKNGGAIFADINADSDRSANGNVYITNTTFNQCSGDFGGALLQLGGTCNIFDSKFIDNSAKENGGAIYTSDVEVYINKTTFTNNKADTDNGKGGALYLDYGLEVIDNCTFKNNAAKDTGAIYIYQSKYKIMNSIFENNGKDIHTCFDGEGTIINCGKCNYTQNDNNFTIPIRYNGIEITLNPQPITGCASDSRFSLRDQGLVTPVKNQGSMGACWTFGVLGAFESAFLIATGQTLDLSENNMQNLGLFYSIYGDSRHDESGTYYKAIGYLVSWLGAINESDDTYDELGKISSLRYGPNAYRTVNAILIDISNKTAVKEFLTTYGALDLYIYGADSNSMYYNATTKSQYNNESTGNHYVTLVGWDDEFPKSNFTIEAPGDGAWICKNSWGNDWGDEGYFYLSYYDKSIDPSAYPEEERHLNAVGFVFDNVEYYEKLYQSEMAGIDSFGDYDTYGHVFKSEDGDIIAAVGTYFEQANTPYTVSIYINDRLLYTQSGKSRHTGYNTIKLDKHIAIDKGSTFDIRIQSSSVPLMELSRFPIVTGVNYVIINGQMTDTSTSNMIAAVKAYTYRNPGITKNIFDYPKNKETIFAVENVVGDKLTVGFEGKNFTIEINEGKGSLSLGVLPIGEYLVTVYYKNQTFESVVSIRHTIDTGGVSSITVGYNTDLTFNVDFTDFDGEPLINTKVTLKFNGKPITAFTDESGHLSIAIDAGTPIGNHVLELNNPKTQESIAVPLKIVSRFVGNKNVNMYYFDGSKYKVRIVGTDGNFVGKNQWVLIKIGKKSFEVKTNAKGYIIFKIPKTITPGKHKITATYFGQTVKNTLTVKQVLKTSKTVKVKRSAKKLVLKATLKKGKTPLKKKLIKFKVNGKTYKAKTNKKGIAKVTIKKTAIKKLKKNKYTVKVSYLNDVVKSTLKVRR